DEAADPVQQRAQVIERAADVDVRDVDVPVLVRRQRLDKARAFLAGLGVPAPQQAGGAEHAIDAGGAGRHDVLVEHHEGQPAITLQRILRVKVLDRLFLPILQPMVARDGSVVLVGLAVAVLPVVILAGGQPQPREHRLQRNLGPRRPATQEIDDLVAGVVWHPDPFQLTPSVFFSFTCSSISSESTSFFWASLASNMATFFASAWLGREFLRSRAAAPFSNSSLCQR